MPSTRVIFDLHRDNYVDFIRDEIEIIKNYNLRDFKLDYCFDQTFVLSIIVFLGRNEKYDPIIMEFTQTLFRKYVELIRETNFINDTPVCIGELDTCSYTIIYNHLNMYFPKKFSIYEKQIISLSENGDVVVDLTYLNFEYDLIHFINYHILDDVKIVTAEKSIISNFDKFHDPKFRYDTGYNEILDWISEHTYEGFVKFHLKNWIINSNRGFYPQVLLNDLFPKLETFIVGEDVYSRYIKGHIVLKCCVDGYYELCKVINDNVKVKIFVMTRSTRDVE